MKNIKKFAVSVFIVLTLVLGLGSSLVMAEEVTLSGETYGYAEPYMGVPGDAAFEDA